MKPVAGPTGIVDNGIIGVFRVSLSLTTIGTKKIGES
jgi:hypothetical protein